jgi:hypothetical protein
MWLTLLHEYWPTPASVDGIYCGHGDACLFA